MVANSQEVIMVTKRQTGDWLIHQRKGAQSICCSQEEKVIIQKKSLITKGVQNYVDIHCASPTSDQVHPNDTEYPAWVELVQEVRDRPTGSLWRVQVDIINLIIIIIIIIINLIIIIIIFFINKRSQLKQLEAYGEFRSTPFLILSSRYSVAYMTIISNVITPIIVINWSQHTQIRYCIHSSFSFIISLNTSESDMGVVPTPILRFIQPARWSTSSSTLSSSSSSSLSSSSSSSSLS